MAGISPEEPFDEVREAAKEYLASMGAVTEKIKRILTAQVLRNTERHNIRTLANIVEPSMDSNLFRLRVIWPSVLGTAPIANLFKHNGNLHMQIFVLCAGKNNQSKLSDEGVHLLAWGHHTFGLDYTRELKTLGDVLQFASWAIGSADISINPCIALEMSLAGQGPIIPDYLNHASTKAFTTKLDGQTIYTIPGAKLIERPVTQGSTAKPLPLVLSNELADSSDDECASSGNASGVLFAR